MLCRRFSSGVEVVKGADECREFTSESVLRDSVSFLDESGVGGMGG